LCRHDPTHPPGEPLRIRHLLQFLEERLGKASGLGPGKTDYGGHEIRRRRLCGTCDAIGLLRARYALSHGDMAAAANAWL
jgi:hypothetical protein